MRIEVGDIGPDRVANATRSDLRSDPRDRIQTSSGGMKVDDIAWRRVADLFFDFGSLNLQE